MSQHDENRQRLYRLLPARLAPWIAGLDDAELAAEVERLASIIAEDNARLAARARARRQAKREAADAGE